MGRGRDTLCHTRELEADCVEAPDLSGAGAWTGWRMGRKHRNGGVAAG